MSTLKKDIIECWFFETHQDAQEGDKAKALSYSRTESGVLKEKRPICSEDYKETIHVLVESDTEVS